MIRAVLDEVVPTDLVGVLHGGNIEVAAFPDGWRSAADAEVVRLAMKAGYHWLITCDKQMPFQQNLYGKSIAVMILPTPQVPRLIEIQAALRSALNRVPAGCFVVLDRDGKPVGDPVAHMIGGKS